MWRSTSTFTRASAASRIATGSDIGASNIHPALRDMPKARPLFCGSSIALIRYRAATRPNHPPSASFSNGRGTAGHAWMSVAGVCHMLKMCKCDPLTCVADSQLGGLVEKPRDVTREPSAGGQQELNHGPLRKLRRLLRSGKTRSNAASSLLKSSLARHLGISHGVKRLLIWASVFSANGVSDVPTTTTPHPTRRATRCRTGDGQGWLASASQ